jgi:uncharacterized membrane protein YkvA (DUF1232 family)
MSDIAMFIRRGAGQITPKVLKGIHKKLPLLKMEFARIEAPKYPHLIDQLEFLANVVEDFAEGADEDLPYLAVAAASFALVYAHRQMDLIPDQNPDYGFTDDSAVVRAVLMEHERSLEEYARRQHLNWGSVTVKP